MDISAIALQGVQQAEAQLEQAATNIASSAGGSGPDVANFTAEALALISAQNETAVNVAMLKVADQVQKSVINLLA